MKLLVLGLDGGAPELLLGDERLTNLRRLMEWGCYGRLTSVTPPSAIPGWICLATGQDPGALGVYGPRERLDRSYAAPAPVGSQQVQALALWDTLAQAGRRSIVVGVPPSQPPRPLNGVWVADPAEGGAAGGWDTFPPELGQELARSVADPSAPAGGCPDALLAESRARFAVARHLLESQEWDAFFFVEPTLDRLQRAFWRFHDPRHPRYEADHPGASAVADIYQHLDDELGKLLELLDDDAAVLVVADRGAQPLAGGVCVNEWLVDEGLLVPRERPSTPTALEQLDVDWARTTAWCQGGPAARVYLNVHGREPAGLVDPTDYERVRDDLKARLEALVDDRGRPLGAVVARPDELYGRARGVAPDLLAAFGGFAWSAVDAIGAGRLRLAPGAPGLDDVGPTGHGAFVLAASNNPLQGEVDGAHLLDLAPTLLELVGCEAPPEMQGRSLVAGQVLVGPGEAGLAADEEEIIRERLMGLGYIE